MKTEKAISKMIVMLGDYNSGLRERHVAAIVKRNRFVSIGFNSNKTSADTFKHSRTEHHACVHAEFAAIKRFNGDTSGLDLFVIRTNSNNELRMSKPCAVCQKIIDKHAFRKVVYSTPDGYVEVKRNKYKQ